MKGKTIHINVIRQAIANYMYSEGCGCCADDEEHERHKAVLGTLLDVPKYIDGSGYGFEEFRTKNLNEGEEG